MFRKIYLPGAGALAIGLLALALALLAFDDLYGQERATPLIEPCLVIPVALMQTREFSAAYMEDWANQRGDAVNAAYFRGRREAAQELLAAFSPCP